MKDKTDNVSGAMLEDGNGDSAEKIVINLDSEQMELLQKLSLFYGEDEKIPAADRIVEDAVKVYTTKQVEYIVSRYAIDIRGIPLAEMRAYKREVCVNTAERDTIVLPVNECRENRDSIFQRCRLEVSRMDSSKASHLRYIAFYWNTPLCAVSHYAKILSIEPFDGSADKIVVCFDVPEELPECIQARDPQYRIRRPRYTMLDILLEAKTLEELF